MTKGIKILRDEHDIILSLINFAYTNNSSNLEYYKDCHEFIKEYGDGLHHKEEENILFKLMIENLDGCVNSIINNVMLYEHRLGREANQKLLESINNFDILSAHDALIEYCNVLEEHINKENMVLYNIAEENFSESVKEKFNRLMDDAEEYARKEGRQGKYLALLEKIKKEA